MYDIIGRIMAYTLGIMMLFYAPILLILLKSEETIQVVAQDAVVEFVDKASSSGQITESAYIEMVSRLDATGVVYDIKITHEKERVTPYMEEQADGSFESVKGSYTTSHENYYEKYILSIISDDSGNGHPYYLDQSDYLKVTAVNKTPPMGSKMLMLINPFYEGRNIAAHHATYVAHEQSNYN